MTKQKETDRHQRMSGQATSTYNLLKPLCARRMVPETKTIVLLMQGKWALPEIARMVGCDIRIPTNLVQRFRAAGRCPVVRWRNVNARPGRYQHPPAWYPVYRLQAEEGFDVDPPFDDNKLAKFHARNTLLQDARDSKAMSAWGKLVIIPAKYTKAVNLTPAEARALKDRIKQSADAKKLAKAAAAARLKADKDGEAKRLAKLGVVVE